jgi:hypothetical protein
MRRHVSPALIISVLALVLAMTAGATAASNLITGRQIKNGSITGTDIKDRSVGADDLQSESIGPSKLSSGLLDDIAAGKDNLPGPAGPTGPTGPTGPAGPAGSAPALNVVAVTSPHQFLAPGAYTSAMRADCPAGTTVVGTGINAGLGNADFVLSYGSFVGAFVHNDVTITIETWAQAICASGATNGGARSLSGPAAAAAAERFARDEAAARAQRG